MSVKHHIVIIDHVHPVLLEKLREYDVLYVPDIEIKDLKSLLKKATVLLMRSKLSLTKQWIDLAPNLQYIGRLGSGMDNIDVEYVESKGIICQNAPEGNRNAVAEQTMAMLLSLLSNIPKASADVAQGIWDRKNNQGVELQNLSLGIIGFGHVGSRLSELLHPFGCNILAYDRYVSGFGSKGVSEASLEQIQEQADIISLHVPLNEFSKDMIDENFISNMKKPFYLLNLSRGAVVNISDLINGLRNGKILGAGIDVLPNEKLKTYSLEEQKNIGYLSDNKNVILTPHIGGLTKDSFEKLADILGDKVLKWMKN